MSTTQAPFKLSGKGPLYIVFGLCMALYANTLLNEFVLDDRIVYTENQFVQKGISGIPKIFTNNSYEGYFTGSGKSSSVGEFRYRPLSIAFFALEFQLFGKNPFWAHLINILTFALVCTLIYKTLDRLWSFRYPDRSSMLAFLSTLLFVVHPIHTEVVANVKSLDEIFALLFGFISLACLLRYHLQNKVIDLVWAGLSFTAALFSKENAIVFIVLMPLALWLFIPEEKRRLKKTWIPLLSGLAIYAACRFAVLGFQAMVSSKNFLENPFLQIRGERIIDMNPAEKFGTIFYTLLRYMYLHIIPYPLTHDYAPKSIASYNLFSPLPLLAVLLYTALIIFAFRWIKSKPILSFSVFVFLIALAPTSNLFIPTGAYMGERFAFIPSLGFCMGLAFLIQQRVTSFSGIYFYGCIAVLLAFSARTVYRNMDWKSDLKLFQTDIEHSSNSAKLNSSLGFILLEKYRNTDDKENNKYLLTQAIGYLKKAVQIYPRYIDCIFLLGNANYLSKNYSDAVAAYESYIQLNPTDVSIMKNYQKALREMGRKLFYEDNNNTAAKNALLKSYKLNPNDDQVLEVLGGVEAEMGYLLKSLEYLLKASEINPNNASTWANLYITYTRLGDKARAQEAINKGMAIDADIVKKLMSVKTK